MHLLSSVSFSVLLRISYLKTFLFLLEKFFFFSSCSGKVREIGHETEKKIIQQLALCFQHMWMENGINVYVTIDRFCSAFIIIIIDVVYLTVSPKSWRNGETVNSIEE